MPDQRDVPETNPDEEPIPALGPVEQPLPEGPGEDPEPIEVAEGMPEKELEPIEVPDEEAEPVEVPEDETEPIEFPEADDEPAPQLIEVVRDLEQRVASQEQELAEVIANMPVATPDDFFARSEPPAGPDEIAGPVRLRSGGEIDSTFTPTGGSFATTPPLIPQIAVGAEEIEWGIAALPDNRPSEDTCAWMRPEVDGSYGYCYVEPSDPPESSLWTFPDLPTVSAEGQEGLVKVTFWGAGYARPFEPNVRGGDLVAFIRVGGIAMGIGYLDAPLGKVGLLFHPDVSTTPPEGWILLDDATATNMPNTNVTTLGLEITNRDVRQTLLVSAGLADPAYTANEGPAPNIQGAITVATLFTEIIPNGTGFNYYDVHGSFYTVMHRIN